MKKYENIKRLLKKLWDENPEYFEYVLDDVCEILNAFFEDDEILKLKKEIDKFI